MLDEEQEDILYDAMVKNDIEIWNQWRRDNPNVQVNLDGIDLEPQMNLKDVNFSSANLRGAYLRKVVLFGANLSGANLNGVVLSKTYLKGANLSNASLLDAKCYSTFLSDSYLSNAILDNSSLLGVNLDNSNLSQVSLRGVTLSGTDFSGSDLTHTYLGGARLEHTILRDVDLKGAICGSTIFANVDLSEVKNLDKVKHLAPSTVGLDTIYKSKGNIPEVFLRGCGVPDEMIAFVHSLANHPVRYKSCYISYSEEDEDFAKFLHNQLQDAGIRCWLTPDIIRRRDEMKVIFCASKNSLTKKWWEVIRFDEDDLSYLLPLNIDDYISTDEHKKHPFASLIEGNTTIDFVGWKNDMDKFNREVKRVIKALQTDGGLEESPFSKL